MKMVIEDGRILIQVDNLPYSGQDEAYLRDTLGGDEVEIEVMRNIFGNQYGLEIRRKEQSDEHD